RHALEALDPPPSRLVVNVTLEDDRIVVHDNAAGISVDDFPRAFAPAQRPPDTSGLSEYGLGLKAAACWFAKKWSVRTCAIGDTIERTIRFNVPEIVANDIEELAPTENKLTRPGHYTTLVLEDLNQKMRGATIAKVKSHLASIYRSFISDRALKLVVNTQEL